MTQKNVFLTKTVCHIEPMGSKQCVVLVKLLKKDCVYICKNAINVIIYA